MLRILLILILLFFSDSFTVAQEANIRKFWPKVIPLEKASITIYRPDFESFNGNVIEVRSAFNYYDGTRLPIFGAMWLRAVVHIDKTKNHVFFDEIEMIDANFPDDNAAKKQNLRELIETVAPTWQFNSSLESFREGLIRAGLDQENTSGLLNDPPNIFYEKSYTELVYVDGEPIYENIDNSELYKYVVNTPFFIVRSQSDGYHYLKAGNFWFRTKDFYNEWQAIDQPPQTILQLKARADEHNTQKDSMIAYINSSKPKLIVSIFPAQLIQTEGDPDLFLIPNTEIYEVKNSPNKLLFDNRSREYYVLFSGRWYKSKVLYRGDWKFVKPKNIPTYFLKIPINSEWSKYRISIPETPEAISAALDNTIPQTAIIDRKQAKLAVEYDGEPQFQNIEHTDISYAINTNISVLKIDNHYHAVDEGVWFNSHSPTSDWQVSTAVHDEIESLPPSVPVYNVKYVYIYDSNDQYVYTGYTGGYTGNFLYQGCVFYGTGYQYNPWYKSKYYSRPMTFAFGITRNYSKSNISVSVGMGYGMGYPGFYAPYGYGYGFGHYGYAHLNGNYEYKIGYERKPFDPQNIYNNRAQGVVASETVRRNSPYQVLPANQQDQKGDWMPPANLYTDSKGGIYRQASDGTWEKRADGVWVKSNSNPFDKK